MKNSFRDILMQILEVIDYQEDKASFVEEFSRVCEQQAVFDLLNSLPVEEQNQLQDSSLDEQALLDHFNNHFSPIDYKKAIENASSNLLKKFLEGLMPSLTVRQKETLRKLLDSLASS